MEREFQLWEKIKDITYQYLDFTLNYRQSGHPGGSHSKAHMLISLLFERRCYMTLESLNIDSTTG